MLKFTTAFTFSLEDDVPGYMEFNDEPSLTVPDQSYTIQELLDRHIAGTMPPVSQDVFYEDDPNFDEIDPKHTPDYDLSDYSRDMEAISRRRKKKDPPTPPVDPPKPSVEPLTPPVEPPTPSNP